MRLNRILNLMNKILLTIALLLFSTSAGRTQSIDDNEKGLSVVKINALEEGLLFYVDDSLVGALTDNEFEIRSGFNKLKVSSATDSWTAVDWTWEGTLIADSVYTFDVNTKQFIMLNTVPFGAKVIINGKNVGTTPLLLEKTNEAVEIVMSNYMPIRLEASQLANKKFIDIILVNELPSEDFESRELITGIADRRDKIITRSTYLVTAIAGISAVYFKFEADKAFRKLPNAILLENRIYLENRIKKYDDRAAVSFGTFQVGFLYSIYRVITR